MVALYTVSYNFVKMHKAVRMTPSMTAGVTGNFWSMTELAEMIEAIRPMPQRRGPYRSLWCFRFWGPLRVSSI